MGAGGSEFRHATCHVCRRVAVYRSLLVILAAGTVIIVNSTSPVLPEADTVRRYFEWGYYDSITTALEPVLRDTGEYLSGQYHVYLGVSYFAQGRIADARSRFIAACMRDDGAELDRDYVSEEIYDLFRASLRECREKMLADSIAAAEAKLERDQDRRRRREHAVRGRRRNLALGFGFAAASVASAGIAAAEYHAGGERYEEYRKAALRGDRRKYESLRARLRTTNATVLILGGCSLAAATAGSVFLWRFTTVKVAGQRVSSSFSPAGVYGVVVSFGL